jgi:hypothetical protein
MVIWPVRLPVAVGVNVTWIEQLAPTATVAFWQLSVSLKSPLMAIAEAVRVTLPVFVNVTVCALLEVPNTWLGKVSASGLAVAVVRLPPAVHKAVCHTPLPYVPAVKTCEGPVAAEALNSTTGASGSPVPNTDQQVDGRFMQFEICVVK